MARGQTSGFPLTSAYIPRRISLPHPNTPANHRGSRRILKGMQVCDSHSRDQEPEAQTSPVTWPGWIRDTPGLGHSLKLYLSPCLLTWGQRLTQAGASQDKTPQTGTRELPCPPWLSTRVQLTKCCLRCTLSGGQALQPPVCAGDESGPSPGVLREACGQIPVRISHLIPATYPDELPSCRRPDSFSMAGAGVIPTVPARTTYLQ